MDKINLNTSLKNIPSINKRDYLTILIMKTEELLRRMKWKAYFFLKGSTKNSTDYYGFKNKGNGPRVEQLDNFEDDLYNMIKNITFYKKKTHFQKKLDNMVNEINNSKLVLVKADKTHNFYKLTKTKYQNLITQNITKNYKKSDLNLIDKINSDSKTITDKLKISDRVGKLKTKEAYILLKDHKTNFHTKPQTRLINPTRQEIGKISKNILEKINKQIKNTYNLNQWINTAETISWFNRIRNKDKCSFIQFDIVNYYPSITKALFENVIEFATLLSNISEDEINIIKKCRTTVLINNKEQWTKKDHFSSFDVSMGSLDSAEVTDLVGLYLLYNLTKDLEVDSIGLYRDDGLMYVKNTNGQKCEQTKKIISKEMKRIGLKAEITSNVKQVNFLDITFNLNRDTYEPYAKDNSYPLYVNPLSNHPRSVSKHIPESISRRISNNSSNIDIFNKHKNFYNKALKESGYKNTKIEYIPTTQNNPNRNKNRNRKIIWYTPPFNNSTKTKIGNKFLNLINTHFPNNSILHKIFNKNTLKLSYCCGDNLEKIIKKHNMKILNTPVTSNSKRTCNCNNKSNCPLNQKCLSTQVVYEASISSTENPSQTNYYIGLAGNNFKERFYNHKLSFNNPDHPGQTGLSLHYHKIKTKKETPIIKWKILKKSSTCKSINSPCRLCLNEKLEIIRFKDKNKLLNRKQETSINCKHSRLYLLSNPHTPP